MSNHRNQKLLTRLTIVIALSITAIEIPVTALAQNENSQESTQQTEGNNFKLDVENSLEKINSFGQVGDNINEQIDQLQKNFQTQVKQNGELTEEQIDQFGDSFNRQLNKFGDTAKQEINQVGDALNQQVDNLGTTSKNKVVDLGDRLVFYTKKLSVIVGALVGLIVVIILGTKLTKSKIGSQKNQDNR